jgi:hypothetical protein
MTSRRRAMSNNGSATNSFGEQFAKIYDHFAAQHRHPNGPRKIMSEQVQAFKKKHQRRCPGSKFSTSLRVLESRCRHLCEIILVGIGCVDGLVRGHAHEGQSARRKHSEYGSTYGGYAESR